MWVDHRSGAGGDILDFVAVHGLGLTGARDDFPRVLEETAQLLDMGPMEQGGLSSARAPRSNPARHSEEEQSGKAAELVGEIHAASVPVETSPAAMAYLRSRGIDPSLPSDVVAFLPGTLVRGVSRPMYDSLVVWAVDAAGKVTGGKRILIDQNGRPAPGDLRKLSFGRTKGAVAKLPGRTDGGPLVVAEGPETALSVWQATGLETWSTLDVGGFRNLQLPLDRKVIFCPDQDAPDSPAGEAFDEAARTHAASGVDLWIARAPEPVGSKRDLNDTLQRAGQAAVAAAIDSAERFVLRDAKGQFTGMGAMAAETPALMPRFDEPAEARKQIRRSVKSFISQALAREGQGAGQVPVLAVAATPGAGKSTITREVLTEILADGAHTSMSGDIVYYAPTLGLAEEAAEHVRSLGIEAHVIRGRSATDPASGQPMCQRADLAEEAARFGANVKTTLCERREGSRVCRCPFADNCAYRRQLKELPPARSCGSRPAAICICPTPG